MTFCTLFARNYIWALCLHPTNPGVCTLSAPLDVRTLCLQSVTECLHFVCSSIRMNTLSATIQPNLHSVCSSACISTLSTASQSLSALFLFICMSEHLLAIFHWSSSLGLLTARVLLGICWGPTRVLPVFCLFYLLILPLLLLTIVWFWQTQFWG